MIVCVCVCVCVCRLDQRTFSTAEFLSAHPSLQTFTFSLAQSQWDSSVHTAYMEALGTVYIPTWRPLTSRMINYIHVYTVAACVYCLSHWLCVCVVYPEPVYGVEEEVTLRKQRQELTRLRKASHYRLM